MPSPDQNPWLDAQSKLLGEYNIQRSLLTTFMRGYSHNPSPDESQLGELRERTQLSVHLLNTASTLIQLNHHVEIGKLADQHKYPELAKYAITIASGNYTTAHALLDAFLQYELPVDIPIDLRRRIEFGKKHFESNKLTSNINPWNRISNTLENSIINEASAVKKVSQSSTNVEQLEDVLVRVDNSLTVFDKILPFTRTMAFIRGIGTEHHATPKDIIDRAIGHTNGDLIKAADLLYQALEFLKSENNYRHANNQDLRTTIQQLNKTQSACKLIADEFVNKRSSLIPLHNHTDQSDGH